MDRGHNDRCGERTRDEHTDHVLEAQRWRLRVLSAADSTAPNRAVRWGREAPPLGTLATRAGPRLVIGLCAVALAGCAAGGSGARDAHPARAALQAYMRRIEPIRLAVNRLLSKADPILSAYHDGRASPAQSSRRVDRLERRFATYTVEIAAIQPATPRLRALHAAYAQIYVLEDAYLSALVAGLAEQKLGNLPNTQAAQRAAIIRWRTGLTVLALQAAVALPADLQQAGRGEIAPARASS